MQIPETYVSSILIILPHHLQARLIPLMQQLAPDTMRNFTAHITVLYPFVSIDQLDPACETLKALLVNTPPFEVTLHQFTRHDTVIFMYPTETAPIRRIRQRIMEAFPAITPYNGAFGLDPEPHVTVAKFETSDAQLGVALPEFQPVTFNVDRLHVNSGLPGSVLPWITHDVILLRGN